MWVHRWTVQSGEHVHMASRICLDWPSTPLLIESTDPLSSAERAVYMKDVVHLSQCIQILHVYCILE
ncbi:hypothetical protein DTO164E3_8747 [Paecilomyces variotii]|nr:hypothetical protein DTO164E3_8747 [Paecilomyces variotii]KAJ9209008.1 hypothetical protein DTO032I3_225 [Paecilomyces variotii]KAJ9222690.1 hypothetical protein DTO169C6_4895 [Paecilomyces variotii]KAJ9247553.1 hypothetical protein DTO207G8_8019 [Paecilomyces variotii]KAJ9248668.1 hypothetical protein DTO195F2_8777 [Paecilomyces variotii]